MYRPKERSNFTTFKSLKKLLPAITQLNLQTMYRPKEGSTLNKVKT